MASGSYNLNTWAAKRIIGDNSSQNPDGALLQSGAGRADDSTTGDTWIFLDTVGGTTNPYGIMHYQGDNKIKIIGSGTDGAWVRMNTGDTYILGKVGIGYNPETSGNTYKLYVNGTSYFNDNITSNQTIWFGANASSGKAILGYNSTYPNYGIWYFDESVDVMTLSASGNANNKTTADLGINVHGAGTLANRNNRIPHTGNTTGSVGGTEQPVYVNAGTITSTSYALKATVNNGDTNYAAYYSGERAISSSKAATAMIMPAHYYHNLYNNNPTTGTTVYVHYYNSSTTSTNSFANLRVKSGTSYKTLAFGGDGSFSWPGTITSTFSGNLTGNVTGNCSGSSGSCTGNAATATRINGNLGAISSATNCNIWVSSTASADGIPKYVSGCYITASTGTLVCKSVKNAVWNDYAECRKSNCEEPGYVITPSARGIAHKTTRRLMPGCRIISDTWGHLIGESVEANTPVAVGGRVLAYPYRDITEYKIGDCVCSAPDGKVDIMTREEIKEWPDRIIGIVNEIPNYEIWKQTERDNSENTIKIKVDGRIWIDIK